VVVAGDPARSGGRPAVLDLLLVCPGGSSLAQLTALEPWSGRHRRWWVCPPSSQARGLLRRERVRWSRRRPVDVAGESPTLPVLVDLVLDLGPAWQALRQIRPDAVVASGVGTAVPYLGLARLLRIPGVYLEEPDRPQADGVLDRFCRRLADRTVVPWEEQAELDPDADVVGCLL
jgi:beta-1,4-N-acetylglucosaminyltransferase